METVTGLAETPDGATLVTAEGDGSVRLREPSTGKERCRLEGVAAMRLAFAADGSTLALATSEAFEVWQLPPSGKQVRAVTIPKRRLSRGVQSQVVGMAFSHDGRALLSLDAEGSACLWDVVSGKPLVRRALAASAPAALRFDRAHRPLVLTTDRSSGGLRVWNIARGEELLAQNDMGGQVTCMAFSSDGASLVTGHEDKALRFWNARTGQLLGRIRLPECPCQVDFAPDGKSLVAGANGQWWRLLLSARHGRRLERPASLTPADSALLSTWRRGWKHRDRPVPWRIDGLEQCALTRDGFLVDVQRNNVVVVEVGSGKKLCQWQQNKYFAASLAPGRRTLAVLRDETTVALAELADHDGPVGGDVVPVGDPAGAIPAPPVQSPPGMIGMELVVWEVPRTEMLPTQPWLFPCLAFAPGGRFVAVGTPRGSILVRDLATNEQVHQLTGHDSPVVMLAFSPQGRTLACAYRDTTVLLWDIGALSARPLPPGSAELEESWRELEKAEAAQAWKAHWALVGSKQTVSFLRARLKPAQRADLSPLAQRIQELDSPRFLTRNRAMKAVESMGQAAEPALREALKKASSLERQRRLEQLLAKIEEVRHRHLQEVRAIAVLEQIASNEAREVLDAVASGDPQAPLTIAARAARKRLNKE
jgi:WD40 repeat protein